MTDTPTSAPARPHRLNLALLVALTALAATGWQWYDTRQLLHTAELDLARKVATADGMSQSAKAAQAQTRQTLEQLSARLAQTETRVNESAGQYATLQSMYLELTRNREDWQQAEVEHALTIASQQLALAGNVKAAISGLEAIDARLASIDKPQYIALRRAISADLIQLKALPHIDRVGLAVRLDQLMAGIDHLPLMVDAHRIETTRPVAGGKPAAIPAAAPALETLPPWQQFGRELWQGFSSLIRIQRMDKPDALLLTPEQRFFLRENLKLRLLDARLALLANEGSTYHADLTAAADYARRYFDTQTPATAAWLKQVEDLANSPVTLEPPELTATLKAAQALNQAPPVAPATGGQS